MYTHSYSFNLGLSLNIHSAERAVRLLNQAGRNNYPYNPKFVGIEHVSSGLTNVYKLAALPLEPCYN